MILTPLIDIDNPNLSLWSLMTKGERNQDMSDRGVFDIGGDMTKERDKLNF